jgi:hypothetical protein
MRTVSVNGTLAGGRQIHLFVARARARAFRHLSRELLQSAKQAARHSVSGRSEDVLHDIYIGYER